MENSLTMSFVVDRDPMHVYDAAKDVRSWWSGAIVGSTEAVGDEWTYWTEGIHYSRMRVAELVPGRRIAWEVTDSWLSFIKNTQEWTGTTVAFDIAEVDAGTELRFTHEGLVPQHECFDVCEHAWGRYLNESLRPLLETGAGRPHAFSGEAALQEARSASAER